MCQAPTPALYTFIPVFMSRLSQKYIEGTRFGSYDLLLGTGNELTAHDINHDTTLSSRINHLNPAHKMSYLQPAAWRLLGLSVGIGYGIFGTLEALRPHESAKHFLGIRCTPGEAAHGAVAKLVPLLGARDLSIAALIFSFHRMRQDREMGMVILAGTILCYADTLVAWSAKGVRS